jgi:hypothetical protein
MRSVKINKIMTTEEIMEMTRDCPIDEKTLKENNVFLIDNNVILDVLLEQDNAHSQYSI